MARFVKFLVSLPFVAAAAALALYALGGFVVAPWWIQRELPEILQRKFNATGSVGEVVINPFLFTIDARNFTLTEAGGRKPAITFDRLFVDFEASSLIHRAWTFAEIALERPRVNLEADENGALNLARLLPKETQPKPEKSEGLPRLLLEKFVLKDGGIERALGGKMFEEERFTHAGCLGNLPCRRSLETIGGEQGGCGTDQIGLTLRMICGTILSVSIEVMRSLATFSIVLP